MPKKIPFSTQTYESNADFSHFQIKSNVMLGDVVAAFLFAGESHVRDESVPSPGSLRIFEAEGVLMPPNKLGLGTRNQMLSRTAW